MPAAHPGKFPIGSPSSYNLGKSPQTSNEEHPKAHDLHVTGPESLPKRLQHVGRHPRVCRVHGAHHFGAQPSRIVRDELSRRRKLERNARLVRGTGPWVDGTAWEPKGLRRLHPAFTSLHPRSPTPALSWKMQLNLLEGQIYYVKRAFGSPTRRWSFRRNLVFSAYPPGF